LKHIYRETYNGNRGIDGEKDGHIYRHTFTKPERQSGKERQTHRQRNTGRQRDREAERERDTETDTETKH